jgi:hypothetical protein
MFLCVADTLKRKADDNLSAPSSESADAKKPKFDDTSAASAAGEGAKSGASAGAGGSSSLELIIPKADPSIPGAAVPDTPTPQSGSATNAMSITAILALKADKLQDTLPHIAQILGRREVSTDDAGAIGEGGNGDEGEAGKDGGGEGSALHTPKEAKEAGVETAKAAEAAEGKGKAETEAEAKAESKDVQISDAGGGGVGTSEVEGVPAGVDEDRGGGEKEAGANAEAKEMESKAGSGANAEAGKESEGKASSPPRQSEEKTRVEYYVKWRTLAHAHCGWVPEQRMLRDAKTTKLVQAFVRNYMKNHTSAVQEAAMVTFAEKGDDADAARLQLHRDMSVVVLPREVRV